MNKLNVNVDLEQAKYLWLYCGLVAKGYALINNKIVLESN